MTISTIIFCFFFYKYSAFPVRYLIAELHEKLTTELCNQNVMIVGDFNIYLSQQIEIFSKKISFPGINYFNTRAGTHIDRAFSNMHHSHVKAITYKIAHSYHDSICALFRTNNFTFSTIFLSLFSNIMVLEKQSNWIPILGIRELVREVFTQFNSF